MTEPHEVEIWEADPFGSSCCGVGARRMTAGEAERFIAEVKDRDRPVKLVTDEYAGSVNVRRELITSRQNDYPNPVPDLRNIGVPLPYVLVDNEQVYMGRFLKYDELTGMLDNKRVSRNGVKLRSQLLKSMAQAERRSNILWRRKRPHRSSSLK